MDLEKNCSHSQDVGLKCSINPNATGICDGSDSEANTRLVDSSGNVIAGGRQSSECSGTVEGRLEVLGSGMWGTVCQTHSSELLSLKACSEMGLLGGTLVASMATEDGAGMAWEINAGECAEQLVSQCRPPGKRDPQCQHSQDIGVRC